MKELYFECEEDSVMIIKPGQCEHQDVLQYLQPPDSNLIEPLRAVLEKSEKSILSSNISKVISRCSDRQYSTGGYSKVALINCKKVESCIESKWY